MKLSRQVREIINVVIFLLVVGLLLTFYVIYPLNKAKDTMGRADFDDYEALGDSLLPDADATPFVEAGLVIDTFRVESDGLTTLSCIYVDPDTTRPLDSLAGTVFLVPSEYEDRNAVVPLAKQLSDAGYVVVTYDQRATGSSTGLYHGEGQYEATDLEALIAWLDLRNRLSHPLSVVGYDAGADAALLTAHDEGRIDKVIAVRPYLTTTRWLDVLADRNDWWWFPFRRTVMWWWYNLRSNYAARYREVDMIEPVGCPTTLIVTEPARDHEAVQKLVEVSSDSLLTVTTVPAEDSLASHLVMQYIAGPTK
ncbi:hypothetical protein GF420_15540 [candidate division GN15 bacterium]|nr:hypothetical protein [candidate division GN15 bacterium]